ncbi:hypothetical protein VitviT2T_020312 [Vitis vinifera]|uniref:Disease resistance N-terminal domain-containing protein n=1 Tax=Vitis vinifera TaxID=29760 RepID=A0ABY9D429_VITVI|nr:hypothetical protein VitviT2T_020312 [Vitis vinifera]
MAGFVGEAVLSGFIQKLVDMVASPELWKYAREEQVDSELNEWKKILMKIYAVLHDAEDKQMTNPLVKMWLHDLRDLAYDVEDILDESVSQALRRNLIVAQPQPPTGTVRSIFSSLSTSLTLSAAWSNLSMGSKIEEITARLQDISAQKKHLDLRDVFAGWSGRKRLRRLPSTSLVIESCIYGRETEKAAILAMLLKDDPSDDEVCVIPIVGMGDIMHSVSLISRYMENPTELHFLAAKKICRYLQGTKDFGLFYKKGKRSDLIGFTDSDYAGDQDNRRSTSGYVFMLGTGAVSWSSKKQPIVTLSTTEAEFVAATVCACQAIWLRKILEELHLKQVGATTIFCDNSSTIKLSKNPVLHGRSKHIDVKYYFLRDLSNDGVIDLVYCRSENQVADIFTKPLKLAVFLELRKLLGVSTLEYSI